MAQDIKQLTILPTTTLRDAMRQLETTEKKILFVVDESDRIIGTITDGDMRRWILSDGDIGDTIENVCNKHPYTVNEGYKIGFVKELMIAQKINCVPVVTDDRIIIDILFWDKVFSDSLEAKRKSKMNIPVVIMAGGKGTRLDPFTKILPKPLIPIGEKSVLEIIIDRFLEYDINRFYLSVNHKAKIIKSYFEELNPAYTLDYINETKPLGTAGSLKYLEGKLSGSMIVTNCDIIIQADYSDILEFHTMKNNDITIVASVKHYNIPYGICEIENGGSLTKLLEKPEYNFLVNTGMYVLNTDMLRYIPENISFHFTDLIETVMKNNGKIAVYPISETGWLDIGEWAEYKKTIEQFTL
jgi:dTDP-glucose pyrophosphorylase